MDNLAEIVLRIEGVASNLGRSLFAQDGEPVADKVDYISTQIAGLQESVDDGVDQLTRIADALEKIAARM